MAHMDHIDHDARTWDCSCGEEDQPWGVDFWDWDEATCRACGARFDLELDGGTAEGFSRTARESDRTG